MLANVVVKRSKAKSLTQYLHGFNRKITLADYVKKGEDAFKKNIK